MDRKVKRDALASLLLATVYYLFFQASKHISSLAQANAFAEDPYDAVGSFSAQLVPFLALLSCLRAFRPYHSEMQAANQRSVIAHTRMLGAIAVALTMLADIIALTRHPLIWTPTLQGRYLALASLGLLLWSAIQGWYAAEEFRQSFNRRNWTLSAAGIAAMITALALFPETLRHTIAGALVTAFTGGVTFIVPLGIIASQLSAHQHPATTDLVDDVIALCEAIKSATPRLAPVYVALDRLQRAPWPYRFAFWINPRRFRWRLPLLSGAVFGLALVTAEFWSEGPPSHYARMLLVVLFFIGLETATVLMGYALLAQPIGLFRREAS
jgi:hypothetical protein